MASKRFIGKQCAYCSRFGISKTADHVFARQFFVEKDRQNLPKVPCCEDCNGSKSALENYALTVLPLGSRHCDAKAYSEANIERRLRRNDAIRSRLSLQHTGLWEQQSNGLLLPIMSVDIDQEKICALFALIVKGLFMFHWGLALNEKWLADVTIIKPEGEKTVFGTLLEKIGPAQEVVQSNLGRGTFAYAGVRSATARWFSLWQFTIFRELQFSNATVPNRAFTKLSVVTRPDMSRAPFTAEEAGVSTAAAA
jgi:hypothetical protein